MLKRLLPVLFAVNLLASGQEVMQTTTMASPVLGPDDQVKIWALGVDEITDKPQRIDATGNIDLPLIGKVHAAGLTTEQFRAELLRRFAAQIVKPQVSVEVVETGSRPISVMGAVNNPGVHQVPARLTLIEAISMAGGLRPDAGPRVHVTRKMENGSIPLAGAATDPSSKFSVAEIDLKLLVDGKQPEKNVLILPHDVITVPIAEAVYVMGEVRKPGMVGLKNSASISVLQALASAEGFGPAPAPKNARIIRPIPGSLERKEILVNLLEVQSGKAEDVAMRPNDILVVPPSAPRKATTRAIEAAIQAATGIAIWRRP